MSYALWRPFGSYVVTYPVDWNIVRWIRGEMPGYALFPGRGK